MIITRLPFDLPPVLLADYPELDDLLSRDLRVTALAVYWDNRMMSGHFDMLERSGAVSRFSPAVIGKLLALIEARLRGLGGAGEAELLAGFVADEAVLLDDNRRRAAVR